MQHMGFETTGAESSWDIYICHVHSISLGYVDTSFMVSTRFISLNETLMLCIHKVSNSNLSQ